MPELNIPAPHEITAEWLTDALRSAGTITDASVTSFDLESDIAAGVGFMGLVQRVHRIPLIFITEAEHIIAFELHGESDVRRLATEGDKSLEAAATLERYDYLWYDRDARITKLGNGATVQTVDSIVQ